MKYEAANYQSLPEREVFKGYHGRFVHTGTMTLAYWKIDAGSPLQEHHHVHTQIVQLISGEFQMTIGGEKRVLHAGDVVQIPSECATQCVILNRLCHSRYFYSGETGL
ncbi:MAG TPA: cupin domain-containing protein [Saprospiraceae bacterium]|nr:cupin domain-containing protein [Saprospiraceae bacterium]